MKWSGPVPQPEMLAVTKSVEQCGRAKSSETLLIGPGGGIKNVVIQILNIRKGKPFASPAKPAAMDQRACTYVPHVLIVPLGSKLDLINSDPVLHNVHGYKDAATTAFNVAMPMQNQHLLRTMAVPGTIRLQCDAGHTWMSAYVVVADNPYYALSDAQGRFSIDGIPPGTYQVRLWHEKLGEKVQNVKVDAGARVQLDLEWSGK